jgi:excisionase family DNA binding protein
MTPRHTQTPDLRLSEAAALLGIHPDTLRRWADEGKVPTVRTPGGERRFYRADIEAVYGEAS